MQDKADDLNAALRSYWFTILLGTVVNVIVAFIYYWNTLGRENTDGSLLLDVFVIFTHCSIIAAYTLAFILLYHLPLLLTSKTHRQRTATFIMVLVFSIFLGIIAPHFYIIVNCYTGEPYSQSEPFGCSASCLAPPWWMETLLLGSVAILSFLCLLNIVQAAKGAVQTMLQERKHPR